MFIVKASNWVGCMYSLGFVPVDNVDGSVALRYYFLTCINGSRERLQCNKEKRIKSSPNIIPQRNGKNTENTHTHTTLYFPT